MDDFDPYALLGIDTRRESWWSRLSPLHRLVIVLSGIVLSGKEVSSYTDHSGACYPCLLFYGDLPTYCPSCSRKLHGNRMCIGPGIEVAFCNATCKTGDHPTPTFLRPCSVEGEILLQEAITYIEEYGGHVTTVGQSTASQ